MVTSRDRTLPASTADIVYTYHGSTIDTVTNDVNYQRCQDVIGNFPNDNPFELTRIVTTGGHMNWESTFSGSGQIIAAFTPGQPSVNLSGYNTWLNSFDGQTIAAATAPDRPAVNLVTDFLEFRDVPRMLKHAGDLLHGLKAEGPLYLTKAQNAASATLAYQFGWAPLISDVLKCLQFADIVSKRQRQLDDLALGKTIHRRVNFGEYTKSKFSASWPVHTALTISIYTPTNVSFKAKCWGTCRWRLRTPVSGPLPPPTWDKAFNSAFGTSLSEIPIQIWKALPWTWMIDWFANVSNALEVSKNLISFEPSAICRMVETTTLAEYSPQSPSPTEVFDGGSRITTTKSRELYSTGSITGIHLHAPVLDAYKLSVLSSLAILALL